MGLVVVAVALVAACGPVKSPGGVSHGDPSPLPPGQTTNDLPGYQTTVPVQPCGCEPTLAPLPPVAPYTGPRGKTVLLVGDSTMAFPALQIRQKLEQVGLVSPRQLIDRWESGALIGVPRVDWLGRLTSYIETYHPNIVILSFIGPGKLFDYGVATTQKMVDVIKSHGAVPVVIVQLTVPNTTGNPGLNFERYADWQRGIPDAIVVDADRWLSPDNQFWWYLRFPEGIRLARLDGIHTSNRSDMVIAELVAAAIRPLWDDAPTPAP